MESILTALRDLSLKDLFTLFFSFAAFVISLIGNRRALKERNRVFRSTLTDVLNKILESNIKFAQLQYEHASDQSYIDNIGSGFSQQNGFLVEQATYIASQIPSLVRTYEWNTIASTHFSLGDFKEAEDHYQKAIQIAPNETQRGQAMRTYAYFLYKQARIPEGRNEFKGAIETFKREDNSSYYNQGVAYQSWGVCERDDNRSPQTADEYFTKARERFKMIDVTPWREKVLSELEKARGAATGPQQRVPNAPLSAAHPSPTGAQLTNISQS